MVISSLVVECAADAVDAVAAALAEQAGVEVHERKGYKLVVTISFVRGWQGANKCFAIPVMLGRIASSGAL